MAEGIAALLIGALHWRYLRREKLKAQAHQPSEEVLARMT
jgi:hypothetical protein